jgi:hypothetical protein
MLPAPGSGTIPLDVLGSPFYVLVGTLLVFVLMFFVLRAAHPNRKRGLDGYVEAAGVSLIFLAFSVGLVVYLALAYPHANRTSFGLFETVLSGYWLAISLPVVTVGSSVQARSRGAIRWLLPSVGLSAALFVGLFLYYFYAG